MSLNQTLRYFSLAYIMSTITFSFKKLIYLFHLIFLLEWSNCKLESRSIRGSICPSFGVSRSHKSLASLCSAVAAAVAAAAACAVNYRRSPSRCKRAFTSGLPLLLYGYANEKPQFRVRDRPAAYSRADLIMWVAGGGGREASKSALCCRCCAKVSSVKRIVDSVSLKVHEIYWRGLVLPRQISNSWILTSVLGRCTTIYWYRVRLDQSWFLNV